MFKTYIKTCLGQKCQDVTDGQLLCHYLISNWIVHLCSIDLICDLWQDASPLLYILIASLSGSLVFQSGSLFACLSVISMSICNCVYLAAFFCGHQCILHLITFYVTQLLFEKKSSLAPWSVWSHKVAALLVELTILDNRPDRVVTGLSSVTSSMPNPHRYTIKQHFKTT